MFSFLSAMRRRRHRNASSDLEDKVAGMNPKVRAELTKDIFSATAAGNNSSSTEILDEDELDRCLDEARAMLQAAMDRENLVSIRLEHYKGVLRKRGLELTPQDDKEIRDVNLEFCEEKSGMEDDSDVDDDDENESEDEEIGGNSCSQTLDEISPEVRERRRIQIQYDLDVLKKVEKDFDSLQEYVRTLKRRVFKMERERDIILEKKKECKDFLLTVAMVEGKEEAVLQQQQQQEQDLEEEDDDDDGEIELVEGGLVTIASNRVDDDSAD
jgi:hypothetical protein